MFLILHQTARHWNTSLLQERSSERAVGHMMKSTVTALIWPNEWFWKPGTVCCVFWPSERGTKFTPQICRTVSITWIWSGSFQQVNPSWCQSRDMNEMFYITLLTEHLAERLWVKSRLCQSIGCNSEWCWLELIYAGLPFFVGNFQCPAAKTGNTGLFSASLPPLNMGNKSSNCTLFGLWSL